MFGEFTRISRFSYLVADISRVCQGILVGAWTASDKIAKVGGAFVLAVPASIIPVALWSQKSPRGEHSGRVMTNGSGVQAVNNEEV